MKKEDKLAKQLRVAGIHAEVIAYRDDMEDGEIALLPATNGDRLHLQVGDGYLCLAVASGEPDDLTMTLHDVKAGGLVSLITQIQAGKMFPAAVRV
ncbi:MAG: hypothetical protein INH43_26855 [Acidobacteriaceae bacterium]|nr:hypothetical protein [Acidobacteriaceae bacterium]